jgi:hypothetical protein
MPDEIRCVEDMHINSEINKCISELDVYGVRVIMIVWLLDLQPHMQSVHITTKCVSSNSANVEMHSIQDYVPIDYDHHCPLFYCFSTVIDLK